MNIKEKFKKMNTKEKQAIINSLIKETKKTLDLKQYNFLIDKLKDYLIDKLKKEEKEEAQGGKYNFFLVLNIAIWKFSYEQKIVGAKEAHCFLLACDPTRKHAIEEAENYGYELYNISPEIIATLALRVILREKITHILRDLEKRNKQ